MHTETPSALADASTLSPQRLNALAARAAGPAETTLPVFAPATTERIGTVPAGDADTVEAAVADASAAATAWATTPVETRATIIDRFGDLVIEHREELLDTLQLETGKSRRTAVEELFEVPMACAYIAADGPAATADDRRGGALPGLTTATVTYDPVGVVGVISPWNYPMTLAAADVLPALLAGNAVVLKPDEKTPYTALALAELLEAAGLPADALTVITGEGATVGPALIDRVDHVAFTGSTETGRAVAARAGENLIECSLELGGNNPLVVLADAAIEQAARGAVQACFSNAGQLCLSAERLYVDSSVFDAFLGAFVRETERLTLGTAYDYEADLGSLIDADQLERVRSHVDDARERGATVVTGGRHRPDVAPYCFEPTVLTGVEPDATVACTETFGPVVSVVSVPDADAAVAAANDSPYGLNASVWAGDTARGEAVARRIECGTVCVNDGILSGWGARDAPMGGVGDSGIGRRHGPEGVRRFLEPRTVSVSRVGAFTFPDRIPTGWVVSGSMAAIDVGRRLSRRTRELRRRLRRVVS